MIRRPTLAFMWSLILFGTLSGCATRYTIAPAEMSGIQGEVDLPNGAADRLILRIDNSGDQWLYLDWSSATIVGLTGYAVPVDLRPSDPLSVIPPKSSVEYQAFPGHHYTPHGYFGHRRSGVERLIVFDADFARLGSGRLTFHLPVCRGAFSSCSSGGDAWSVATVTGTVRRRK